MEVKILSLLTEILNFKKFITSEYTYITRLFDVRFTYNRSVNN